MSYQGINQAAPPVTTAPLSPAASLRCQWCSVSLQAGTTTCPTCGSQGVPDSRMIVPGSEREALIEIEPSQIVTNDALPELEPSSESDNALPRSPKVSYLDTEDRQLQTYGVIIVAVVVCVALGWLAGPMLAGPMESLTGTPVENTADLRPTGGFLGLLAGFLIGATGGWAIWSGR